MRAGTARFTNAALGALCIAAALFLTVVPALAGPPEGAGPPGDGPAVAAQAEPQGGGGQEEGHRGKGAERRRAPAAQGGEADDRRAAAQEEEAGKAEEKQPDTPAPRARSNAPGTVSGTPQASATSTQQASHADPRTLIVSLHEPHRSTSVEDWASGCIEGAVWHFVLTQLDPGTPALTLAAEFEGVGEVTAPGRVVGNGSTQHFHVPTGVPETVLDAWAEVTATVVSATGPMLVISDVACAEGPPRVVVQDLIDVSIVKTNDADGDAAFTDEETHQGLSGTVPFRAVITNTGEATVEIAALVDRFGSVSLPVCSSLLGHTLEPGAKTVCQFSVADYQPVDGLTTINTVEVLVRDPDDPGRTASAEDPSTVHFVRVEPVVVTSPPSVVTPPGPTPEGPTVVFETLPFTGLDLVRMALLATGLTLGGWSLLAGRREEGDLG